MGTSTPSTYLDEIATALHVYMSGNSGRSRFRAHVSSLRRIAARVGVTEFSAMLLECTVSASRAGAAGPVAAAREILTEALAPARSSDSHGAPETVTPGQNELIENETRRIAQEIHDSAGQMLAAVHLEIHRTAASAPSNLQPRFRRITELLDDVESDLRRISHELCPPVLDDDGLLPALSFLCESVSHRARLEAVVTGSLDRRLPSEVEFTLYRVAQEALTNAVRHSRARRVTVCLECSRHCVMCEIFDDGVGLDTTRPPTQRGLGLAGICKRVRSLGGTLCLTAPPDGRGTRIVATIPLTPRSTEEFHVATDPAGRRPRDRKRRPEGPPARQWVRGARRGR